MVGFISTHPYFLAELALDRLNYEKLMGREMRLMWWKNYAELKQSGGESIFIKNFHESISHKDLHEEFSLLGKIATCKV